MAPVEIGLCLFFLWQLLGPSALAGITTIIFIFPLNGLIAKVRSKLQIAFTMFGVYVLTDEKNVLDAQKVFVSLALINMLKTPLSQLPFSISTTMQASCCVSQTSGNVSASGRAESRRRVQSSIHTRRREHCDRGRLFQLE
ncbi:multidrug resistance-associated protein 1-like [Clarias magur]|uniref:Multidrug resistance-associated protein 1-like n=1 Tax=Clarias magur TaxID=1594786 RepID=A0A8J4TG03_CLAMG|nr:multidrug resistance-associated protein 1-like [Clarias magur]